jgi:hypothetical protein
MSDLFKMPVLFRFGMLLHQKASTNDRINQTIVRFTQEDVYDFYEAEYNRYLDAALDGHRPPCDECFRANSAVMFKATIA